MSQPNILFLMTDEQKWDTLGVVNPQIHTPNLDSLVKDSLFFKNAYCSNPSCIPSRAAMATGMYPTACQCPTFISKMPADDETFMHCLQKAGYTTAIVGKQHFAHSPVEHGFDYEALVDGHTPMKEEEEIKPYIKYLKENQVDPSKCLRPTELLGAEWIQKEAYHIDSFVGQSGKEWLKKQIAKDKENKTPWFFQLSFPGPHQPYAGEGTSFDAQYSLEDMKESETTEQDLEGKPPHFKKLNPKAYVSRYSKEAFQRTKRSYYANVSLIDAQIGEVIALLKEHNLYEQTMIIYTTDHGDFMGDFGMVSKAQYLSEALMHIPLIVKPPVEGFKGRVIEDYVTNIDIASTCLSVANHKEMISTKMENHPYSDYWEAEKVVPREFLYMEAHDIKGVIMDGIKVVYYVNRDYGELYDLIKDPIEKHNLWTDAAYQDRKLKALGKIIDEQFRLSPKSEEKWNVNAPAI